MKRRSPHYASDDDGDINERSAAGVPMSSSGDGCFFSNCMDGENSFRQQPTNSAAAASSMETPLETLAMVASAEPSVDPESTAQALLERSLNEMTIEVRNEGHTDVHGVGEPVKEDEELITQTLSEFESEILSHTQRQGDKDNKEHNHSKKLSSFASAYLKAEEQSKEFVEDRNRRLTFLRAESFDAKKAAVRFMKYFDGKLQWFGSEQLTKKITISDMNDEDMGYLRTGAMQVLPARDRAGRGIIFCNLHEFCTLSVESSIRISILIAEALTEDEETQRNGIVHICSGVGHNEMDARLRRLMPVGNQFLSLIPLRVTAMHVCCDSKLAAIVIPLLLMVIKGHHWARFRLHTGKQTEYLFALMTFGIPVDVIPLTNDGKTKCKHHLKWMQRRREEDSIHQSGKDPPKVGIDLPSQYDVLLGRGKPFQNHPGNQRFRHLIATYKEKYESATKRGEKVALASSIVEMIKSCPGRFLVQDDKKKGSGWWYEVTDAVAREKVSHAFRNRLIQGVNNEDE